MSDYPNPFIVKSPDEDTTKLPYPFEAKLKEGPHYYAYSEIIEPFSLFPKARATVTLPKIELGAGHDFGAGLQKRNAYIALGVGNVWDGYSFDMGLSNKGGNGWRLCFGGSILRDAIEDTSQTIPTDTEVVDLVAEATVVNNKSVMVLNAVCKRANGSTIKKLNPYRWPLDKVYPWNRYYRFVSFLYNEWDNPSPDGSYLKEAKFTDLGLFDGESYVPWGIWSPHIELAWIVDAPDGSFSGNITDTSEIFNINNAG